MTTPAPSVATVEQSLATLDAVEVHADSAGVVLSLHDDSHTVTPSAAVVLANVLLDAARDARELAAPDAIELPQLQGNRLTPGALARRDCHWITGLTDDRIMVTIAPDGEVVMYVNGTSISLDLRQMENIQSALASVRAHLVKRFGVHQPPSATIH